MAKIKIKNVQNDEVNEMKLNRFLAQSTIKLMKYGKDGIGSSTLDVVAAAVAVDAVAAGFDCLNSVLSGKPLKPSISSSHSLRFILSLMRFLIADELENEADRLPADLTGVALNLICGGCL